MLFRSAIVLRLLREGGKATQQIAKQGMFSQMLGGKVVQMVRIRLSQEAGCIPEISANKYMMWVRFMSCDGVAKPQPIARDFDFSMSLCNF